MKNRNVGFLIIGISIFIGAIIWLLNFSSRELLGATCSHGPSCGMYNSLNIQTWLSVAIALVVFFIGLFFVFVKENEKIIVKKIKPTITLQPKQFDKRNLKNLDSQEKQIMNLILNNKGSIFQSELVDKIQLGKVRVTRILDSLEAQGLVERKRRGMTNIVMLKR